jgi:antirestriction protein ArdC
MPRGEYEPRDEGESREDRVRQAVETLEHGIDSILTSETFAGYLRTLAHFHQYSFGNVLLIGMQRPDATRVAGYRTWQELGRQVKKGEKGIKILVPYTQRIRPENEEDREGPDILHVRGFGVGTVFDIGQTDGEPLPEPPRPGELAGSSAQGRALYDGLLRYLDEQHVPVVREDTRPAHGYYNPLTRTIGLHQDLEGDQAAKTLVHETAHLVADHTLGMDKRDVETIAESAAFVVLNHAGVDSAGYSFPYIAHWAQDRTVLKRNLDAVQKTAHQIIDALEQGGALPSYQDNVSQNLGQPGNREQYDEKSQPSKETAMAETERVDSEPPGAEPQMVWEANTFVDGFEEVHLSNDQLRAIEQRLEQHGVKGRFRRRGDA